MADKVKNYGITGVASNIQLGKGGSIISGSDANVIVIQDAESNVTTVVTAEGTELINAVTKSQLDPIDDAKLKYQTFTVAYDDTTVPLANALVNTRIYYTVIDPVSTWTGADSSTTITVGDSGDTDRLFTDFDPEVQTTDELNHVYSANTIINAYVSAGGASAGNAQITIWYMGTLNPPPEGPTYSIAPDDDRFITEGNAVTLNVTTTNVDDGTLYWTVSGTGANAASSADFVATSGTVTISGGSGSFTVTTVEDYSTEGNETFIVQLRTDSVGGTVVATTSALTISDTSRSVTITPDSATVDEGNSVVFTIATDNFGNGTLYYTVTGSATAPDFENSVLPSGEVVITNDTGTVTVTTNADGIAEGTQTFALQIRTDSVSGTVIATSESISILDTSRPTYSVTANVSSVNEGDNVGFTVTTLNVANTTLYYRVVNNSGTDSERLDLVWNGSSWVYPILTGVPFSLVNNTGYFEVPIRQDFRTRGNATFHVDLRTTSSTTSNLGISGGRSSSITILDTTLSPTITSNAASINEGDTVTFTIDTSNSPAFGNNYDGNITLQWVLYNSSSSSMIPISSLPLGEYESFDSGRELRHVSANTVNIVNNIGTVEIDTRKNLLTSGNKSFQLLLRAFIDNNPAGTTFSASSTPLVTLVDSSKSPTITRTPATATILEGDTAVFDIDTTLCDVGANHTLYYSVILGGSSENEDFGTSVTGNVDIVNNTGTLEIPIIADYLTEGNETFQVRFYSDSSRSDTSLITSYAYTITDASTASTTPEFTNIEQTKMLENSTNNIEVTATNTLLDGRTLTSEIYWTLEGTGANPANLADFVTTSGSVTLTNNSGTFAIQTADNLGITIDREYVIKLRKDSVSGTVLATSKVLSLSTAAVGDFVFTTAGTYNWTAPEGVTEVHVVAVGGGGGGRSSTLGGHGGAGGGLGYKNSITVTPGTAYTVVVGAGGEYTTSTTGNSGGDSYFISNVTVAGLGGGGVVVGSSATGGTYVGDGGGNGGGVPAHNSSIDATGGGGAGGYSGNGGDAGSIDTDDAQAGSGGGGGGGGAGGNGRYGGPGGGVGLYGEGSNGTAGVYSPSGNGTPGGGGSGGEAGRTSVPLGGGAFGGGGGGVDSTGSLTIGNGAGGAVRIVWGADRSFPSSNVSYVDPNG